MSDLISRSKTIEFLQREIICLTDDGEECKRVILNCLTKSHLIPPVEAVPTWIPCSERLPEKRGHYLVCSKEIIWVADYFNNAWWGVEKRCRWGDIEAWMPLPEPYKGE